MASTALRLILAAVSLILAYLFISPTPLGIQPTQLPQFTLEKYLTDIPNIDLNRLKNAHYIQFPDQYIEDVAVTSTGDIYAVAGKGPSNIYRVDARNLSIFEKIGQTSGRALGTALNKNEDMLAFIDEVQGLKVIDLKTKQITLIASQYRGEKFVSLNSVAFSANPDILYFTHSCDFSMTEYHLQVLYKTGTGAVYEANIKTKEIKLIIDGLQFANGIVYSQDLNCLYVVEINKYQIIKISLSGTPSVSVVIDNLAGYPDNLKLTQDGKLWVAIPSLRDRINVLIDNTPIIRKALINSRITQNIFLSAANLSYSGGLKVDPKTGKVIDYFFGEPKRINFVTGIVERNRKLYLASLKHNVIAIVDYI